jgi:hypothetical protein
MTAGDSFRCGMSHEWMAGLARSSATAVPGDGQKEDDVKLNEAIRVLADFAGSVGMQEQVATIVSAAEFAKAGRPGESAKVLVDVVAALLVEHEARAVKSV